MIEGTKTYRAETDLNGTVEKFRVHARDLHSAFKKAGKRAFGRNGHGHGTHIYKARRLQVTVELIED